MPLNRYQYLSCDWPDCGTRSIDFGSLAALPQSTSPSGPDAWLVQNKRYFCPAHAHQTARQATREKVGTWVTVAVGA